MTTVTDTDTDRLARAFAAVLLEWLGPETMRVVVEENQPWKNGGEICCSGDHCDSNMAMVEAYLLLMG